jgi:hypothetical protein
MDSLEKLILLKNNLAKSPILLSLAKNSIKTPVKEGNGSNFDDVSTIDPIPAVSIFWILYAKIWFLQ